MAKTSDSVHYESEKKRKHALIIAIALFLFGIILIIVGTYSYYRASITGTVTGTVAIWKFKVNDATSTFNIDLVPQTSNTLNQTIAPDTNGSFSIVLSTATGELPVDYTITFSNFVNKPTNLKFYSDSSFNTETDITASGYKITGTLAANSTVTKTIYWQWPYGTSASIIADNADAFKNVSFSINVLGKQRQQ